MSGFGNWLRNLGYKFSRGLTKFMAGRYGTDKLSTAILGAGVVLCVVSIFVRSAFANLILTLLAYVLMFWAIFRIFSRNISKRYEENRKFLRLFDRIKDRDHRYFTCPRCSQSVRVPKGKGKISITCPRCKEKFVKKT